MKIIKDVDIKGFYGWNDFFIIRIKDKVYLKISEIKKVIEFTTEDLGLVRNLFLNLENYIIEKFYKNYIEINNITIPLEDDDFHTLEQVFMEIENMLLKIIRKKEV